MTASPIPQTPPPVAPGTASPIPAERKVSFDLAVELSERIDAAVEEAGITKKEWLTQAISHYLDPLPQTPDTAAAPQGLTWCDAAARGR